MSTSQVKMCVSVYTNMENKNGTTRDYNFLYTNMIKQENGTTHDYNFSYTNMNRITK